MHTQGDEMNTRELNQAKRTAVAHLLEVLKEDHDTQDALAAKLGLNLEDADDAAKFRTILDSLDVSLMRL